MIVGWLADEGEYTKQQLQSISSQLRESSGSVFRNLHTETQFKSNF